MDRLVIGPLHVIDHLGFACCLYVSQQRVQEWQLAVLLVWVISVGWRLAAKALPVLLAGRVATPPPPPPPPPREEKKDD